MATFNSCTFIGRLGKDPDFTVIPSGTPVAKFSLAVDQGKDRDAMWLNVMAWDKLAGDGLALISLVYLVWYQSTPHLLLLT